MGEQEGETWVSGRGLCQRMRNARFDTMAASSALLNVIIWLPIPLTPAPTPACDATPHVLKYVRHVTSPISACVCARALRLRQPMRTHK